MTLDYWEKQLVLYTKRKYLRVDYDEDLNTIVGNAYGFYAKDVDFHNTISFVSGVFEKLVEQKVIAFNLKTFITDTLKSASRFGGESKIDWHDVIKEMLVEISGCVIEGLKDWEVDKKLLIEINKENLFIHPDTYVGKVAEENKIYCALIERDKLGVVYKDQVYRKLDKELSDSIKETNSMDARHVMYECLSGLLDVSELEYVYSLPNGVIMEFISGGKMRKEYLTELLQHYGLVYRAEYDAYVEEGIKI